MWKYERTMVNPPRNKVMGVECEDAISRQAVLDTIKEVCFSNEQVWVDFRVSQGSNGQRDFIIKFIESSPSVTPKQKMGQWIEKDGYDGDIYYDCSECGESWVTIDGTPWDNGMKYCPNCGAMMEEARCK